MDDGKNSGGAQGASSSQNVTVKFLVKKFSYKGKEHDSEKLEAAAAAGDADALKIIQELTEIEGCSVIEVINQD